MRHIILFAITFFNLIPGFGQNPISRIEPPNWWVNMQYNEIELLIHGERMAQYRVSLEPCPGVSLLEHRTASSNNYLFLTLKVSEKASPGNLNLVFNGPEGKTFTRSYPLMARKKDRREIKGFDSSDAIYLITPDRFVNADPGNDNAAGYSDKADRADKNGRHGGDIKGIHNSLDYISNLGFTSIWMNPVLENKMPKNSYHGYAITDYYKVDPRFGSNEMFRNLCNDAAEQGIKVIMDMVANHCGSQHWWMKDLPSQDWINQWPEYTETNHRKTVVLDPYASRKDTKRFLTAGS